MDRDELSWIDAMHLASASLPIGGFAYSQGLEQACELGLVRDVKSAQVWISDYLLLVIARQEMPHWSAAYRASRDRDWLALVSVTQTLASLRETAELRLESQQMGHAIVRLYEQWNVTDHQVDDGDFVGIPPNLMQVVQTDYTSAHAALCGVRQMPVRTAMAAWLWSWLDNQVLAAVKLVPLGQHDGQALLHALKPKLSDAVELGLATPLAQAGSAPIGLVLASTRHETQYARLFRS